MVVGAWAQLGEGGGLDPVLFLRPAGDGIERDAVEDLPVVKPGIGPIRVGDELRRKLDKLRRKTAVKQLRWLHHVVVDADQNQVIDFHQKHPSAFPGEANPLNFL